MKKMLFVFTALVLLSSYSIGQCNNWWSPFSTQVISHNQGWVQLNMDQNDYGAGMEYVIVSAQAWASGFGEAGFDFYATSGAFAISLYASEHYAQLYDYGSGSGYTHGYVLQAYAVSHSEAENAEVDIEMQWGNACF